MSNLDRLFIIIFIVGVPIFLLLRELFCWYFKINKRIELQQSILEALLKNFEQNGGDVNWEAYKKEFKK